MSMCAERKVRCLRCKRVSTWPIWTSLNAQLDPDARKDLLEGKLLLFTCVQCGQQVPLRYPLLYHDMNLKTMIQLSCDGSEPDDAGTRHALGLSVDQYSPRLRVVDSWLELKEKIHIFESEQDDRIMEIFKAYMQKQDRKGQYPPGCVTAFSGFKAGAKGDEITLAVLLDQQCAYVRYPARQYLAVHNNMIGLVNTEQEREGPHPLWRRINTAYARRMLHYDE